MKARFTISLPGLQPLRFGWLPIVLGSLLCSFVSADEPEVPYDERLLPVAITFLDLLLCSGFADEFEGNEVLAKRYRVAASTLYESAIDRGWNEDLFASAMVVAHEGKSLNHRKQEGNGCPAITTIPVIKSYSVTRSLSSS